MDKRSIDLRGAEAANRSTARLPGSRVPPMTREERARIEALKSPSPEDRERFKEFLAKPGTGIVKLRSNDGCVSKGVVNVAGNCADFVADADRCAFRPDAISSDLRLLSGRFQAKEFLTQSLLGDLGNVDLAGLSSADSRIAFISAFAPAADHSGAARQASEIAAGIGNGASVFNFTAAVELDHTYVLRTIAYKIANNVTKQIIRKGKEEDLNQVLLLYAFKRDKRIDMTVAFKVIRLGEDGSVTVIWKELARKEAPAIKFEKDEEWRDFK